MASREVEKRRRKETHKLNRKRPHLDVSPTILIVCDGKNTEPSCFNSLKFKSVRIEPIGEGYNTISLVKRAEQLAHQGSYDEVLCVFDKDDFSNYHFNQAITLAEANGFHVAYSNQAFEFWIILHFNDHQGGLLHRKHYDEMINQSITQYEIFYDGKGAKIVTPSLF